MSFSSRIKEKEEQERKAWDGKIHREETPEGPFRRRLRQREEEKEQRRKDNALEMTRQYTPELTDIRRQERNQINTKPAVKQKMPAVNDDYRLQIDNLTPKPSLPGMFDTASSQELSGLRKQADWMRGQDKARQRAQRERDKLGFTPSEAEGFVRYDSLAAKPDFSKQVKAGQDKLDVFDEYQVYTPLDYFNKDRKAVKDALQENNRYMTEEEKNLYYYLNGRYGPQAAGNYIKSITPDLNARGAEAIQKNAAAYSKEHPVLGTVGDAAAAVSSGVTYPALLLKSGLNELTGNDIEMDANDPAYISSMIGEGVRSGVSENETLKRVIPNEGIRDFAVGTGLSMAENVARLPFGKLGLAAAGGSAGLSGTRDALERGGNTDQALALGAANAAAEAFFEKFSLEGLDRFKTVPGKGVREFLKNMGKQAVTEGSEEIATEIANTLSDKAIMGSLSQYNQTYEAYRNAGMDEKKAKTAVFKNWLEGVGLAGLGGAVSGGIMGGGSQALGNMQRNMSLNRYGSLIDPDYQLEAEGIDTKRENYQTQEDYEEAENLRKLAEEYAQRQRDSRKISNREKAEYDLRLQQFTENMQRRSEEIQREEETIPENLENQMQPPAVPENLEQMAREYTSQKTGKPVENTPQTYQNWQEAALEVEAEQLQGEGKILENKPPEALYGIEQPSENTDRTGYGKNGAEALEKGYDGSVGLSEYNKAFGRAYDAGYHHIDLDIAENSAILSVLTNEQMMAAYKAGIQDYNADHKTAPQFIKGAQKTGGLGETSELADENQKKVADYIGKKTGLKINLVDGLSQENATASYKSGEITLSVNSGDFLGSMSHELTHFIKEQTPQEYQTFQEIVIEAQMKASGKQLEDMVEDYYNRYSDAGQELTRQEVLEEITADATQKFLNDEEFIEEVARKDKTLAQKIIDFLSDVIDSIKALIKKGSTRQAAKNLEEDLKYYEDARDLWFFAVEKAGESYKAGDERTYHQESEKNQLEKPELVTAENLEQNFEIVRNMDPVAELTGKEFPRGEKVVNERILEFYNSIGGVAHNDVVGDVLLDNRAVKDDINHGISHAKVVSFAAVPDVIEKGKVLDHQINWKGRGYDSATIGAKITIAGEEYFELVVVKLKDKNHMYLHSVQIKKMGELPFNNQLSQTATQSGAGTSGDSPNPSGSSTTVAQKQLQPANGSMKAPDSDVPRISSIFKRLMEVKGENEKSKGVSTASNAATYAAPSQTSETWSGMSLTDSSISGDEEKVNTKKERFQLEDVDESTDSRIEQLMTENEELKKRNAYLQKQMQLTPKAEISQEDIKKTAKRLLKTYQSTYSAELLEQKLTKLYSYIRGAENPDNDAIRYASEGIAKGILNQAQQKDTALTEQYRDLRRQIKNTKLTLSAQDKGDMASIGGYNAFRKRYFGKISLGEGGISVDSFYQELCEQHPELFSEEVTHPADELMTIAAVLEETAPQVQNPYNANMSEMTAIVAQEIQEAYLNLKNPKPTFADRKEAEFQRLRWKYQEKTAETIQKRTKAMRQRRQAWDDERIIMKDVRSMQKWLFTPGDKNHIPEGLRVPVAKFLSNIDFSRAKDRYLDEQHRSKRSQEWLEAKDALSKIIKEGNTNDVTVELDDDVIAIMDELYKKTKDLGNLDELDARSIRDLKNAVTAMKKAVLEMNTLKLDGRNEELNSFAVKTHRELKNVKNRIELDGIVGGTADKLFNYDMLDPQTMFGMMGSHMKELYDSLRNGLDNKARHLKEATTYAETLLDENHITRKQLREWTGKGAKVKEYEVFGGKLRLTTAQIMSLYELNKREQAQIHMYNRIGGISVERSGGKRVFKFISATDSEHKITVTEENVKRITDKLTPSQKALADGLQQFMEKNCANWGNETTMEMYGYKKFRSKHYFPISTDKNHIATAQGKMNNNASTIKNMGMTKNTTRNANNPVMIEDIFEVFSRQVDRMSTYDAYVIPLSDLNKVLNYRDVEGEDGGFSIKEDLERAFGKRGLQYIDKLILDINGTVRGEPGGILQTLAGWQKSSAISGNLRVAIQQPTAFMRAYAEMDAKYLTRGAMAIPTKGTWDLICKYAPIAQWKDWGFYRLDTSRQLKNILFPSGGLTSRANEIAMVPAEEGDKIAWRSLWRACEFEIRDKREDLKPGTEAFYEEVGRRFGEVVDKTQVVDSVLHRSQIMRSQDGLVKMATSFMAEPIKSYDMLYRASANERIASAEAKRAGKEAKAEGATDEQKRAAETAKKRLTSAREKVTKAAAAYVLTSILVATVASIKDAERDDDREKTFAEKYKENWKANVLESLTFINNIPYIKDIAAIAKGNTPKRTDMQGVQNVMYAIREIYKSGTGDSKYTPEYVAVYALENASRITPTPIGNIIREARSMADTLIQTAGSSEQDYEWLKKKYTLENKTNLGLYASMMIEARREGNKDLEARIKKDLNQAGIDNDSIGKKIKALIGEELISKDAVDPRIDLAAQAAMEGNNQAYKTAIEELMREGYSSKLINSAVDKRMDQLNGKPEVDWEAEASVNPDDLYEDVLGSGESEEITYKSRYSKDDLLQAVKKAGGTRESYKEFNEIAQNMYDTKLANGTEKSRIPGSIKSTITSEYKEKWIAAYKAGDKKTCEDIQNKLKQLKVNGKTLYSGDDWISWRKEAREKSR